MSNCQFGIGVMITTSIPQRRNMLWAGNYSLVTRIVKPHHTKSKKRFKKESSLPSGPSACGQPVSANLRGVKPFLYVIRLTITISTVDTTSAAKIGSMPKGLLNA